MLPADLAISQYQATQRPIDDPRKASSEDLRDSAESFEAVFLSQMLAPMFQGLETDGPFGGGPGEDIYRSLLVDEIGKQISKNGGIGIADAVHKELLALQEI